MLDTVLCYIFKNDKVLMLYRNKKKNDLNEGKWIGIGGKVEKTESYINAVQREIKEETGLELREETLTYCGIVHFRSDKEDEEMYLYKAVIDENVNEKIIECNEGKLSWIDVKNIFSLKLWEGDKFFLNKLLNNEYDIDITLEYMNDKLISVRGNNMSCEKGIKKPSSEEWLIEAKKSKDSDKIGMYLIHNGVVRASAKNEVYNISKEDKVIGMDFTCDLEKANKALDNILKKDGVYYARVWLAEGRLKTGDDIMQVLVGADIREHCIEGLTELVKELKTNCVSEKEIF